ncbi:MAG: chorismate mutase [Clostridia bacterium]|nr:chorismate mutase [Clostridia bacterium]
MGNIESLRRTIDEIDEKLVALFEERMAVVEKVAAFKMKSGTPLKDEEREVALIEKNVKHLKNKKYSRFIKAFFKDMMEYSRSYQRELIQSEQKSTEKDYSESVVGFQGIEGSFSSIALTHYFKSVKEKKAFKRFENVFDALLHQEIDYGILPIENSSTGAINEVYDLMKQYEVQIVGDYYLPIKHHLIALKGATLEDITQVFSHEQGFKQSRRFLSDKKWQLTTYFNTAQSVKHVMELSDIHNAAIGSVEAANAYNMTILKSDIQDQDFNSTRFVIVAMKKEAQKSANKISLILRLSHEPKALYKVLDVIAKHNVNMHKLESRPIVDKPWAYLFYIDIDGDVNEPTMKKVLEDIKKVSHDMIILGNYYSRNGVEQ